MDGPSGCLSRIFAKFSSSLGAMPSEVSLLERPPRLPYLMNRSSCRDVSSCALVPLGLDWVWAKRSSHLPAHARLSRFSKYRTRPGSHFAGFVRSERSLVENGWYSQCQHRV